MFSLFLTCANAEKSAMLEESQYAQHRQCSSYRHELKLSSIYALKLIERNLRPPSAFSNIF
jgi:hypothetical protein